MSARRHAHRRDILDSGAALENLEDIWPVFSDIAISIILFLIFMLVAQFLELSQVFDTLARKRVQQTLWQSLDRSPYFHDLIQAGNLTMTVHGTLQRFGFASDIVFVLGEADLQPRGGEVLAQFARFLSAQGPPDLYIEVEGHTDRIPVTSGRYRDNWELSTERALTVVRLFQQLSADPASGVTFNPQNISAIGYGEFRPLEDKKESFLNRRIEIRLDYSKIPIRSGSAPVEAQ